MYQFQTTTGVSPNPVNVRYEVEDGLVYDVEVRSIATGEELSGYLTEYVNNCIEMECFADYRAKAKQEAANAEYDRGEDLYNERKAA